MAELASPALAEPDLLVVGIDHHRTPVALRERLAIPDADQPALATRLRQCGVREIVILSTCNRVELYCAGAAGTAGSATVLAALSAHRAVPGERLAAHAYRYHGRAALMHLFRVAGGLESLVLGEDQILRQVKDAYERACLPESGCAVGAELHPLFQRALSAAKAVRSDTGLGRHKRSVASVAVELARHIQGELTRARLLLIGAGETAELVLVHLLDAGVRRVSVINRSRANAEALVARHPAAHATIADISDLGAAIAEADLVVTSTAAPRPVITLDLLRSMRRRGPLVLIDVAVPRDVDPAVSELDEVFRYDIDDLEQVVAANRDLRSSEIAAAEALLTERVDSCIAETHAGSNAIHAAVAAWFSDLLARERAELPAAQRETAGPPLHHLAGQLQHRLLRYLKAHQGDAVAERAVREILGI